MRVLPWVVAAATGVVLFGGTSATAATAVTAAAAGGTSPPSAGVRHFTLYNGSKVDLSPDGLGVITGRGGKNQRPFATVLPHGRSALGDRPGPSNPSLLRQFSVPQRTGPTGSVVLALANGRFDGGPMRAAGQRAVAAHTTDPRVNAALRAVGASYAVPMFASTPPARLRALTRAARARLGRFAVDLSDVYLVSIRKSSAASAALRLAATPGVGYAAPDFYVTPMDTGPTPLPSWVSRAARQAAPHHARQAAPSSPALPTNFGLTSSLQSYLNSSGVDLMGGYADIASRLNELPGTGETVTNVSLGDLTDQGMCDAGDTYVCSFGPTTILQDGQRYLDYPALPLIPTYTASLGGSLDPTGSVEHVDPYLQEVLLDFSMMAGLPDGDQRPGAQGNGVTDLLGVAPGASYRLVEPDQPTYANVAAALLAAAQQTPRPDVITASLGFGTDTVGFPGRYLEDDPVLNTVISGIVAQGTTVTISANDGTRTYTPAAVGPDGGSTPTDLAGPGQQPTSIADDANSTTPSLVPDSGAIAVGGTTLDDTIAVPPQDNAPLSDTGTFAETRLDGATNFSSGFGTRIDVSAPSDNIAALMHECLSPGNCQPTDAVTVLDGGTSASAPMTAAAAADLLGAAKAIGKPMTPAGVRTLLEQTGRPVPTQPQIDRTLQVGPQIDLSAAVRKVLPAGGQPGVLRVSVAQRQVTGNAGASFTEMTDPTDINLQGPVNSLGQNTGENLVAPITFGIDVANLPLGRRAGYAVVIGGHSFTSPTPAIRLMPAQILAAAGLPVVSATDRTVQVTAQLLEGGDVVASQAISLTFGPCDGTHLMAPAPVVPPVAAAGSPVTVQYDLTGIPDVSNPELIVSSINHWSPFTAPIYRIGYSVSLTQTSGTVTIPASAFAAGGGVYGVEVLQKPALGIAGVPAALRIEGGTADQRPPVPTLAAAGSPYGHQVEVSRGGPSFSVQWDASSVPGADGAELEISAPGPTIYNMLNTFTNVNGTEQDNNGGDTGSVAMVPLPGVSGTTTLNATQLGLSSSLQYTVRVLALQAGTVVGQASGVSSLAYDDGLAPGGATVTGFDIEPGAASTVSTAVPGPNGGPADSAVYGYSPQTGQYGAQYADDPTGQSVFTVLGSDPATQHMLAEQASWSGTGQDIRTYDTTTQQQVADVPIDSQTGYYILGGRVDTARHRMVMLGWRGTDGADTLLPVDTSTGQLGTPVVVGNGTITHRFYRYLSIDGATGDVDLAGSLIGDLCVIRNSGYTTVDLGTGTSTPMTTPNRCITGVASDQAGHAELTVGPLFSFPMYPAGRLQQAQESDGTLSSLTPLGADSPLWPVVDPVHNLLVVGFLAGPNYRTDNNAMSGVGVYDLSSGQRISYLPDFNLFPTVDGFTGTAENIVTYPGIQLDPATRTGWTFGANGTEVEQFNY